MVADQEVKPVGAVVEVHEQVAGLLGRPGPGRVDSDHGDMHVAGAVFDHDEQVARPVPCRSASLHAAPTAATASVAVISPRVVSARFARDA